MVPCYVVAEVGINHNGSLNTALQMMELAKDAGADCVKFQKRTLPDAIPLSQRERLVSTPWGEVTYLDYKRRLEFDWTQYLAISTCASRLGIAWTVSVWDPGAAEFMQQFPGVPFLKIPSAKITDLPTIRKAAEVHKSLVLSTGMSTLEEVTQAVQVASQASEKKPVLLHCVSTYPAEPAEVNLRVIRLLKHTFNCEVGYSGHERGTQITLAAVAMGATFIERHFTLDRTMWGTDQAASLEPHAFRNMVRDIRIIEEAMGDVTKAVQEREIPIRAKLRG